MPNAKPLFRGANTVQRIHPAALPNMLALWLLSQRRGTVTISDVAHRDDCTEVHVPENCKGWVTGNRGSELRRMETEYVTQCIPNELA
ncbi:unnamed protein product [Cladocopium goreaui]|uniref:K Homology domain-containing protein n=1 Tax=Cladocopium goreaui TaxID=2562237 RepID=A0A9P1M2E7_9DINO|nr:unnamed protein product [Cladocopium goreaui]